MREAAKAKIMNQQPVLEAMQKIVEGTARATGEDFCRLVVRHLTEALKVKFAFVTECANPEKTRVRTLAFWTGATTADNFEYDLDGTPCRRVVGGETLCYLDNLQQIFPDDQDIVDLSVVSYAATPLLSHTGEVLGHLAIMDQKPMSADDDALRNSVLRIFSSRTAAELERKRSDEEIQMVKRALEQRVQERTQELSAAHKALEQAYTATIEGWSRALDLRDKETEGHCERVTEMTLQLARAYGVPAGEMDTLRWGCLLHDIGKMGIPDGILLKPGKLTDEEWEVMRRHPDYAFHLLEQIEFLRPALDIPHYHHEKWDGTGYPRGLKGEQIPLQARLFAMVDVWDALRSDRPYRRGWPDSRVREHIASLAGSHFDPSLVELFLEIAYPNYVALPKAA